MDFLRELMKMKEGFDPDFHKMSDAELMDLCVDLEMEDACELDDDGRIVNREALIRDLEAGRGPVGRAYRDVADVDVPMEPRMECVVFDGDKKVKAFDTMSQAKEFVKKHKDRKLRIEEAKKLDPVGHEDADVDNDGDVDASDRYLKHRRKVRAKSIKEAKKLDPVGKEDRDVDNDGDVDRSDEYLMRRRQKIAASKKKQVQEAKTPVMPSPSHGGKQGNVSNKPAKQAVQDEIGNKGMKGMKKKDRPYMEKPRFRDWLTANMFFTMTKSGELAGKMKLGEGFWGDMKSAFSSGMKKKLMKSIPAEHHKDYDFESVKSVGDAHKLIQKAKKAGHIK